MTQNNILSFIFAGVLFLLVMLTRVEYVPDANVSTQSAKAGIVSPHIASVPRIVNRESSASLRAGAVRSASIISAFPERKNGIGDPEVNVRAAFVGDLDSSEVYFQKNESQNWAVASLTKLMTAVVAEEYVGNGKIIEITPTAIATTGASGGLGIDEQYSVQDLVRAMLVASSNDAAAAIAESYGNDLFIAKMNEKAVDIGMTQTKFFDATGLSLLNQSSVSDLLKLITYITKNHSDIFEITRMPNIMISNQVTGSHRQVSSIIKFAGRSDFLGGKTGYNEEGTANLVSIFSYEGHRIVIIVLGAVDQEARFTETESLLKWFKESYIFE